MALVSTIRSRTKDPDQICADAFDLARRSLAEDAQVSADAIGDYLGAEATADRVVTHFFNCTDPGYTGWRWAVTVTRAPRSKVVTVDESVLVPGADSLLAPAWVPWQDRLRPGDVGIGDLLPASADDERLVPFVVLDGDDAVTDWFIPRPDSQDADAGPRTTAEIEVPGRSRVLSAFGRDDTAERWYEGDHGPHTPVSEAAAQRHEEPAADAVRRGGLRDRRMRPVIAFVPALGRVVATVFGQHPGPSRHLDLGRGSRTRVRVLGVGPGEEPVRHRVVAVEDDQRHQALVVGAGGQQVADADVTGAQPVLPGHPGRREQRVGARQQDALVDRDDLRPRRAGHRDRPPPPRVAGIGAVEKVRDDAIGGGLGPQIVADRVRAYPRIFEKRAPGQVKGVRADLVRVLRAASDSAHECQFSLQGRRTARAGPLGHPP